MAKPRTNYVVKEGSDPNLLRVWTPALAKAKGRIEAIEGVVEVFHSTMRGSLNVWINPCYSKTELKTEIRAVLSKRCEPPFAQKPVPAGKRIADMNVGEGGYVVSWAVGDWSGYETLGGLNLSYRVRAKEFGTADTPICRTRTGWVVGGKVFTEPKMKDRFEPRPSHMPHWVEPRSSRWRYIGWIKRPPVVSTFEDLVANACESDHGGIRGVDVYPEGAACWVKK